MLAEDAIKAAIRDYEAKIRARRTSLDRLTLASLSRPARRPRPRGQASTKGPTDQHSASYTVPMQECSLVPQSSATDPARAQATVRTIRRKMSMWDFALQ